MSSPKHTELDAEFIASQEKKLQALRKQLVQAGDAAGAEESALQNAVGGEPQDAADDGDRFAQQGNDEAVLGHYERRLIAIDRALEKIKDHTYGISDGNGEPIPRDHLEAFPESIYTFEELKNRDKRS
jgi:DnaK suppressor protein